SSPRFWPVATATASVRVRTSAAATAANVRSALNVNSPPREAVNDRRNHRRPRRADPRRPRRRRAPAVLPPPEGLPVLGRQLAEDRLQGRQAAAALRLRTRQDRALADHRRVGQEAARTGQGHQALPLPGPAPLRREIRRPPHESDPP